MNRLIARICILNCYTIEFRNKYFTFCLFFLGLIDLEDALTSPVLDSEILKPSKREGNQQGDMTISQAMPTHAKPSRRTTSLLNLFISNSQGTF